MLSQTQKSFWSALKCAPVFIAAAFLAGCGKEEIQTYQIPKEKPATVMASAESNAAPLRWTVPQGWQEKPATGVRAGYLIVPGANGTQAEVTIIPFPGMVGTELDNVNRWRREINLEPITEKDISSQKVQVGSDEGNLYDISGAQNQTLATVLEKEGTSWFFKMRGDKATVSQSKETFLEFLKSIQFQAAPSVAETKPVARPINTNSKRVPAAAPPPENFTGKFYCGKIRRVEIHRTELGNSFHLARTARIGHAFEKFFRDRRRRQKSNHYNQRFSRRRRWRVGECESLARTTGFGTVEGRNGIGPS